MTSSESNVIQSGTYVSEATSSTCNDYNFAGGSNLRTFRIDCWVDIAGHALGELEGLGVCVGVTHCGLLFTSVWT